VTFWVRGHSRSFHLHGIIRKLGCGFLFVFHSNYNNNNKCTGDDTKSAARQILNCIKNKKNKIWRKTIFNMADGILTPSNVACSSGIVTVNSPSGSTLQGDTWLWDDMPLNSPKRPPYWNSKSGFHFHTSPRSRHVILYQSAKFYPNRTTLGRKKVTSCRFSRWRISAISD